jgi:hypothetical protein
LIQTATTILLDDLCIPERMTQAVPKGLINRDPSGQKRVRTGRSGLKTDKYLSLEGNMCAT